MMCISLFSYGRPVVVRCKGFRLGWVGSMKIDPRTTLVCSCLIYICYPSEQVLCIFVFFRVMFCSLFWFGVVFISHLVRQTKLAFPPHFKHTHRHRRRHKRLTGNTLLRHDI